MLQGAKPRKQKVRGARAARTASPGNLLRGGSSRKEKEKTQGLRRRRKKKKGRPAKDSQRATADNSHGVRIKKNREKDGGSIGPPKEGRGPGGAE